MKRSDLLATDHFNCSDSMSDEENSYLHCHEMYAMVSFLEGESLCYMNEKEYKLGPQNILLIPPEIQHRGKMFPRRLCRRISIHFTPDFFNEDERILVYEVFNPKRPCYLSDTRNNIGYLTRSLLDCKKLDGEIQRIALRSRMVSLLTELIIQAQEIMPRAYHNKLIKDVLDYLADNIRKPVSLKTVAQYFGISKNYLNTLFQKETDTTVNRYIREQRLFIAHEEIIAGKYAEEAAFTAGFNDYSTFYRAYKTHFGISPVRSMNNPSIALAGK